MAAASDAVWAVDLGNNSLKALHLVAVGEAVQVIGFDHIPHGKVLASGVSAAEKEELVAITLRQFAQNNDLGFDPIIISVPSQNSFARFVTLPPVEAKRLPEIVRFEAAQQIPFDMNEIQWDWQLMSDPDSPEKRVGLFAIKNEVVNSALESFEREELQISYVQMAPMALYNYLLYDRPDLAGSDKRATVIVNIGAENTDLVVCTASSVWQRCIMMGGNTFTNAIAETFKLSFEKAEKLKRTAPVSKYARQIFQAMRPVITDWTGEVQRSLGFYTGSNPDVKLTRVVAMGGGTKLRGLVKYLSQTLQIPAEKPDAFKRLAVAPGVSAAKFHENVSDFGVVYGLGLQGLGMARIESNLLPKSKTRALAWEGKMKYFIGAAVMLLIVSGMCLGRVVLDKVNYTRNEPTRAKTISTIRLANEATNRTSGIEGQKVTFQDRMKKAVAWFRYRAVIPQLHEIIMKALPNAETNPEQRELYEAFARGDIAKVKQIPREERKQLFLTTISIYYHDDLAKAQFRQNAMMRRDALMMDAMMMEESEGYDDEMRMQMEQIYGADYMQAMMGTTAQAEKYPGFVVMIEGYSPYRRIGELLDPSNVKDTPAKWGFVTRLENLKQFLHLDVNSPFEIYTKESDHFKLETGPADPDGEVPMGVGQWKFIPDPPAPGTTPAANTYGLGMGVSGPQNGTWILIDPMTNELISAEPVKDQYGNIAYDNLGKPKKIVHDYWFKLQFKILWHEAPKSATPAPGGATTALPLG
jgi:type IV pilus assembly protein PilM